MGNATAYTNKKWVAYSNYETDFNNHETHTTCMYVMKKALRGDANTARWL